MEIYWIVEAHLIVIFVSCFVGLRVAYLGGKFNASLYQDAKGAASAGAYHEDDVDALRAFADDKAVTDLFLSYPAHNNS